jgi:glutamine---fructose-6-phosphate transaminase (isomerizing)
MCGIVAYIGQKEAYPIILRGLKRLEYRGYDSAGIAILNGDLDVYKKKGKVKELEHFLEGKEIKGNLGMGHTRWATHGEPNDINAHPHFSSTNRHAMIHNGIIENYSSLKTELESKGYKFISETDSEVFITFIEYIQEINQCPLEEAVRLAINEVIGAYAIVVISKDFPNQLIAARKGSPLVIGVGGDGEFFLASDATPIVEYTNKVVYLDDFEIASIKNGKLSVKNAEDVEKTPKIQEIEMALESIEKGGFDHFMLKEIFEQPKSIRDSLRGRLHLDSGTVSLGGIREYLNKFINADRIIIVACGTSWHAGLVAEYLFEEFARIPVEVEYASEFRYRKPVIQEGDVVIAISQSGETADTLAAMNLAKQKGAIIFGVCNVVGSSIARLSHEGAYTHAGPEIGVASTKAFTTQITVLTLMAMMLAQARGTIKQRNFQEILTDLESIPNKISRVLDGDDYIQKLAEKFQESKNFLYLGRGYNFPVALEGALKLKEISYIHAEGYPAAEMKHGPIALIDKNMPVVFIATRDSSYEKVLSNIQEVKARKGIVIAIVTEGDEEIKKIADHTIEVPHVHEALMPMVSVVPLQLLSYHIAVLRDTNVDQPRNLAKSVTVE